MIKDSPGFYYTMATLHGFVAIMMLVAAYWSYETEKALHVAFSVLMAFALGWLARACFLRASILKKEPIQPPVPTRGKGT